MSVAIAITESDIADERPIFTADDPVWAWLDEQDAREAGPEFERARLRALGAPAHLAFDLSDADALWVPHDCISDASGSCPTCVAYVTAGGVL